MKRLNIHDANVFDKWRELYHELTTEEQKDFYNDIELVYPTQQSFTKKAYQEFFKGKPNLKVLEFGGWKGELSKIIMKKNQVCTWINIELCTNAIEKSVNSYENYCVVNPGSFQWFKEERKIDCDVFISAHSIEHISDSELIELLKFIKGIKYVILEAPIEDDINNWDNYLGTHILKMGWNPIIEIMKSYGYTASKLDSIVYLFTKAE